MRLTNVIAARNEMVDDSYNIDIAQVAMKHEICLLNVCSTRFASHPYDPGDFLANLRFYIELP